MQNKTIMDEVREPSVITISSDEMTESSDSEATPTPIDVVPSVIQRAAEVGPVATAAQSRQSRMDIIAWHLFNQAANSAQPTPAEPSEEISQKEEKDKKKEPEDEKPKNVPEQKGPGKKKDEDDDAPPGFRWVNIQIV